MNKYDKQYESLEKVSEGKSVMQKLFLDMKLCRKWNDTYPNKLKLQDDLFYNFIYHASEKPEEFIYWIKTEIFPKINTSALIKQFIIRLSYELYGNENKVEQLINSLKKLGLVKDIIVNYDCNSYDVVSLENKKYHISQATKEKNQAELYKGYCHFVTEDTLKVLNNKMDFSGCCILFYDLFNNPYYHSYVINDADNEIIDLAHNVVTSTDFYTDCLKYEILLKEKGNKILAGIEELKAVDSEFTDCKGSDFLKYVMHRTQIKK